MTDTAGIYEVLTIDGSDLSHSPGSLAVEVIDSAVDIQTPGDSYRYNQPPLAGLPDREFRFSFELPFDGLPTEAAIRQVRRLQKKPGTFTFAYWKPVNEYYTATDGQVSFYLPRHRLYAAAVLSRDTAEFPFTVWRESVAQTVAVVAGSSVTTPTSGNCNVATAAATTGTYKDYVEFRLSACTAGDEVEIEFAPLFIVRSGGPRENYPDATLEQRALLLIER